MNIISANLNFYLRRVDHILPDFDKEQNSLNDFNSLNQRHPNIKFVIQKKINHSIVFLDVFVSAV